MPLAPVAVIQAWPAVLDRHTAAAYLGESETQFIKIVRLYPSRLRSFNLLENGETKWLRDTLDAFLEWRESVGVERKAS